MVGELAKRVVNAVVLFLATVTFFLVPLGQKTPAQHLSAILGTAPAREAADACADAGRRVAAGVLTLGAAPKPPPSSSELEPAD